MAAWGRNIPSLLMRDLEGALSSEGLFRSISGYSLNKAATRAADLHLLSTDFDHLHIRENDRSSRVSKNIA